MVRVLALLIALLAAWPAAAQERRPSHCIALVQNTPGLEVIHLAGFRDPLPEFTVRLHYVTHSSVLVQTPGGLSALTDYNGFWGTPEFVPTVATMNRAHSSHWTAYPDERIPHVLPGWREDGAPANYHLDLGEMLVRSVSTDIRSTTPELGINGNSIFIFEVGGLCIGHLGHLHHEPTNEQYAAIGRLDIVMAPVDGGMTVDVATMTRLLKRLRSSIVIPIHWFGGSTLDYFLAGMSDEFVIDRTGRSDIEVSLRTLPERPTVVVLEPSFLQDDSD